jgi:hypothetical protein
MGTEIVYLVFDGALKAVHDHERHDRCTKAYGYRYDCNLMDRGRKSARLLPADSFRYEVRKVQNYGLILASLTAVSTKVSPKYSK